eukprot:tig00020710_g13295.t1
MNKGGNIGILFPPGYHFSRAPTGPNVPEWVSLYWCECEKCKKARSPATSGIATAGFCGDFLSISYSETIGMLHMNMTDEKGYKEFVQYWQGELDNSVAKLGEQALATVSYALRLALGFNHFEKPDEVVKIYERFLAPRLLDEKRRDELLGAATPEALADHARAFAYVYFKAKNHARAKKIYMCALDVLKRLTRFHEKNKRIAEVLWLLGSICVQLKEWEEAWRNFQSSVESYGGVGCQCCVGPGSLSLLIGQWHGANPPPNLDVEAMLQCVAAVLGRMGMLEL